MSSPFVIIETADLQWQNDLPYSLRFDDVYFCSQDGFAEKQLVFLEGNQLSRRWQALAPGARFTIGETGFGTALNFLLTWQAWLQYAPPDATLYYYSCEKFPLKPDDLSRCLALWPQLCEQAQELIKQYPLLTPGFHRLQFAAGRVQLILMLGDAQACFEQLIVSGIKPLDERLHCHFIDAWYLDGFSPAKNEAMWQEQLFTSIALLSHAQTTLATYSAAAKVKHGLQHCGFIVQKLAGFANKRHRLTARYVEPTSLRYKTKTPWHRSVVAKSTTRHALVIGAGLAGCFSAHALAQRGWQVTIVDAHDIAAGASGNEQAVLYPNLSAYASPLTQFMLTAFLYAQAFYRPILGNRVDGELKGILQLAHNDKEAASQKAMQHWLSVYPQLGRLLDAQQIGKLVDMEIDKDGLFIPLAGWINSKQLCCYLLNHKNIEAIPHTPVAEIIWQDGAWHAASQRSEQLIIANSYQAQQFNQTAYLPLKPIRGQITKVAANRVSGQLPIPLCGEGHVLPLYQQGHHVGASYELGIADQYVKPKDDVNNLAMCARLARDLKFTEKDILTSWSGIRAATPDYLPIVGAVPKEEDFLSCFASLSTNAKRVIKSPMPAYPGLYICAGFGSRGLTTIPLSAQWLAALINQEPTFISNSMVKSLSPARFLYKKIVRLG